MYDRIMCMLFLDHVKCPLAHLQPGLLLLLLQWQQQQRWLLLLLLHLLACWPTFHYLPRDKWCQVKQRNETFS